jgi:hypothetical protein
MDGFKVHGSQFSHILREQKQKSSSFAKASAFDKAMADRVGGQGGRRSEIRGLRSDPPSLFSYGAAGVVGQKSDDRRRTESVKRRVGETGRPKCGSSVL